MFMEICLVRRTPTCGEPVFTWPPQLAQSSSLTLPSLPWRVVRSECRLPLLELSPVQQDFASSGAVLIPSLFFACHCVHSSYSYLDQSCNVQIHQNDLQTSSNLSNLRMKRRNSYYHTAL